jgi:starch-binding outer membrane protein, SusD/RagB family
MKKITILLVFLGLCFASCDNEYIDPTKPSQDNVFSNRAGLIGVANGLQSKYSVGRQSPVYTTITGNGFTTNEFAVPSSGNADEAELWAGGSTVSSKNGLINNLWSQSLVINSEAQKVLDNIGVIGVPAEKASVFAHASIFKALALGNLIQYFEKVPIQTMQNSPFNTKAEVLASVIKTLKDAEPYLPQATGFAGLAGSIKYKNTVNALLARFYMISGDNDNALAYANLVDLTSKSTYLYDAVTRNPIADSAFLVTNNYQPINRTLGLPVALAPITADGRINFYINPTPATGAVIGAGFFDSFSKLIPIYLPSEMTLIKAEAYARKTQLPLAVIELNKVLTKTAATDPFLLGANLPAYSGTVDQASILTEIYRNRCIELYMSGLKLEDTKRFGRPGPGAGAERNRNYYPYPDSERFNNTNTPADPAN